MAPTSARPAAAPVADGNPPPGAAVAQPDRPRGHGVAALQARLAALEQRVAALEAPPPLARGPLAPAAPDGPHGLAQPTAPGPEDRYWLLSGLRRQLPAGEGGVAFGGLFESPEGQLQWQIGLSQTDLLAQPWESAAPVFAALGHPVRLKLLRALLDGVGAVQALALLEGLGTSGQVYHHLRDLEAAGWVHPPRRGHYAVPPARVIPLLTLLAGARA